MKNSDKIWVRLMELGARYGCHQKPERSFFINGFQFPICARCTGILLIKPLAWYVNTKKKLSLSIGVLLLIPMLIDGGIQYLYDIKSTNRRRLLTGLLGGFGISTLRICIVRLIYKVLKQKCSQVCKIIKQERC